MNDMTPIQSDYRDKLPEVRGRLRENVRLDKVTWFQVGGPADFVLKPEDEADLSEFLTNLPFDIPILALGVGSNLLIRDGGIRGVVLRLGRHFAKMKTEENRLVIGAGALDGNVARFAADAALEGAEFLSGIPGSIGGALRMNAGAYGTDMSEIFVSAVAYDRQGMRHVLMPEDMGFAYRHCEIPKDWVFTQATLQLSDGSTEEILARMADISRNREESQPVRSRTGGSTFANPPGKKAWELIESVGGRGLQIGGAKISDKHCNFIINSGAATAADLEAVGEEVRRRVFETHDVLLRWEIVRLGDGDTELEGTVS